MLIHNNLYVSALIKRINVDINPNSQYLNKIARITCVSSSEIDILYLFNNARFTYHMYQYERFELLEP